MKTNNATTITSITPQYVHFITLTMCHFNKIPKTNISLLISK